MARERQIEARKMGGRYTGRGTGIPIHVGESTEGFFALLRCALSERRLAIWVRVRCALGYIISM